MCVCVFFVTQFMASFVCDLISSNPNRDHQKLTKSLDDSTRLATAHCAGRARAKNTQTFLVHLVRVFANKILYYAVNFNENDTLIDG